MLIRAVCILCLSLCVFLLSCSWKIPITNPYLRAAIYYSDFVASAKVSKIACVKDEGCTYYFSLVKSYKGDFKGMKELFLRNMDGSPMGSYLDAHDDLKVSDLKKDQDVLLVLADVEPSGEVFAFSIRYPLLQDSGEIPLNLISGKNPSDIDSFIKEQAQSSYRPAMSLGRLTTHGEVFEKKFFEYKNLWLLRVIESEGDDVFHKPLSYKAKEYKSKILIEKVFRGDGGKLEGKSFVFYSIERCSKAKAWLFEQKKGSDSEYIRCFRDFSFSSFKRKAFVIAFDRIVERKRLNNTDVLFEATNGISVKKYALENFELMLGFDEFRIFVRNGQRPDYRPPLFPKDHVYIEN